MVTLGITKYHVARQTVGRIAGGTSGGFEYSVDCPRSTRRRAAGESEYTYYQEGKPPSLHTSSKSHHPTMTQMTSDLFAGYSGVLAPKCDYMGAAGWHPNPAKWSAPGGYGE